MEVQLLKLSCVIPDFSPAFKTLHAMAHDAIERAPYFLVALLVFGLFLLASTRARRVLQRSADRAGRGANFSALVARLGGGALLSAGALVALTVAFPSFTPATIFSVLGFGGVAAGFALRDILGNLLCGLVILASEPFRIGDRIAVKGFEGEVEDVQTRATTIRTRDGRRVVLPNTVVFNEPVEVVTAFSNRRLDASLPLSSTFDWQLAKTRALDAMMGVAGVESEPAPQAFLLEVKDGGATLGLRWWINNNLESSEASSRDAVLMAVSQAIRGS
jgi:small conductance mechanosensitive channel